MKWAKLLILALCVNLQAGDYRSMTPIKAAAANLPVWSPTVEGGCLFAYESWRGGSVTVNGSNEVTQWSDQCPSGTRHAVQDGSQITFPVYMTGGLNSQPYIKFDPGVLVPGSKTYQALDVARAHSVCWVGKFRSQSTNANYLINLNDATGTKPPSFSYKEGVGFRFDGDNGGDGAGSGAGNWQSFTAGPTNLASTTASVKVCYFYDGTGAKTNSHFSVRYNGSNQSITNGSAGYGDSSTIGNYGVLDDTLYRTRSDVYAVYVFDHAFSSGSKSDWDTYINYYLGF